jgi:hypothetical protein
MGESMTLWRRDKRAGKTKSLQDGPRLDPLLRATVRSKVPGLRYPTGGMKPIQTQQNTPRVHVPRGLEWLADVFHQFAGILP